LRAQQCIKVSSLCGHFVCLSNVFFCVVVLYVFEDVLYVFVVILHLCGSFVSLSGCSVYVCGYLTSLHTHFVFLSSSLTSLCGHFVFLCGRLLSGYIQWSWTYHWTIKFIRLTTIPPPRVPKVQKEKTAKSAKSKIGLHFSHKKMLANRQRQRLFWHQECRTWSNWRRWPGSKQWLFVRPW